PDPNHTTLYPLSLHDALPISCQIANDSQTYGSPANLAGDLGTTVSTGVNGQNLDIAYSSAGDTTTAHVGSYAITGTLSNGTGLTDRKSTRLNSSHQIISYAVF